MSNADELLNKAISNYINNPQSHIGGIVSAKYLAADLVSLEKECPEIVYLIISKKDTDITISSVYQHWFTYRANHLGISFVKQHEYFKILQIFS